MDENLLNKIDSFFQLYDEIMAEKNEGIKKLSEYDKKISETYHKIEGMKFGHVSKSHKVLKEFQILLRKRRTVKGNNVILQILNDNLKNRIVKCRKSIDKSVDNHQKLLEELRI